MVGVGSLCCQTPSPCPSWASVSLLPRMLAVAPPPGGPDTLGISSGKPEPRFPPTDKSQQQPGLPPLSRP